MSRCGETSLAFKEFRSDGWPLCPECGQDELYCDYGPASPQEAIEVGLFHCYYCLWNSMGGDELAYWKKIEELRKRQRAIELEKRHERDA